jgi:hypothetical protein
MFHAIKPNLGFLRLLGSTILVIGSVPMTGPLPKKRSDESNQALTDRGPKGRPSLMSSTRSRGPS